MIIKEYKDYINEYLRQYFDNKGSYNKLIYDASSYSLNIGGKRIRPILLLIGYNMYKSDWKKVVPMAGAIEMIHTYSLIHDDLPCMDNDDLRRGLPTNHKKFGENIAVLAGDTLLNEAMSLMCKFSLENDKNALIAMNNIVDAAGPEGMIGGQVVDIINEGKVISKEELNYMHLKKTAELLKVSITSGAILGGAPQKDVDMLDEFGEKLGLAFQIKDDILDIVGSVEKLGKNTFSDVENEKTNFISVYGLEYCQEECERLTRECLEILNKLSVETINLESLTCQLLERDY